MKIEDILKKQGDLYRNLVSSKKIKEYNEAIEPDLVLYQNHWMSKQEYKVIKEIEKTLKKEAVIVDEPTHDADHNIFEILIKNNKATYLRILEINLEHIPKSINDLKNLSILGLYKNKITKIKNLDNLENLQILWLDNNQIKKIENLDSLQNLKLLMLSYNKIKKIENLDSLPNLQILWLLGNQIENKEEAESLRKKGILVHI